MYIFFKTKTKNAKSNGYIAQYILPYKKHTVKQKGAKNIDKIKKKRTLRAQKREKTKKLKDFEKTLDLLKQLCYNNKVAKIWVWRSWERATLGW